MPTRPFFVGLSTCTCRSNRPGRRSAGSSTSGRLVAAMTMTASDGANPSISPRIWFSVCSRSSLPPPTPAPRSRPTASISSMKMMQGDASRAVLNRSRTRLAPTPTNIWMNSLPLIEKNGTSASPAVARASSVLPVPGDPISSTPLGISAPSRANFSGAFRNSTTSIRSCFACSMPATSAKVVRLSSSRNRLAPLLMNPPITPPPPLIGSALRRSRNRNTTRNRTPIPM